MAGKTNYEAEMKKLEGIVSKLESGNLELEDALRLFEEGVRISADCTRMLDSAQERMEILVESSGRLETIEFNDESFDKSEEF